MTGLISGEVSLRGLPGVGPTLETRLQEAGITTVQQIAAMTLEQLCNVKGVGEKTAQKLLASAQEALTPKPEGVTASDAVAAEPPPADQTEETPPPPEEAPQAPEEPTTP